MNFNERTEKYITGLATKNKMIVQKLYKVL